MTLKIKHSLKFIKKKIQYYWFTPTANYKEIHSFIHSAAPSKRILHTVGSSASPFNLQYVLVSLKLFRSCLRLLPRLPVTLSFPVSFIQELILERFCYARCDLCSYPSFFSVRIIFLSSLNPSNISSFLIQSVHILRSVQVP